MESSSNESIKNNERNIHIEYSFKNDYGVILGTYKSNELVLDITPSGATEFDGYVSTPIGSFAFEGPIKKAQEIVLNIKQFLPLQERIKELKELKEKLIVERNAQGPSQKNDFTKFAEFQTEYDEASKELATLQHRQNSLQDFLRDYLI